jgi:F-type H+-transporting ATPase subunit delta
VTAQQIEIIEGPPEAVDKVYAQALFELAEAEGGRQLLEELAAETQVLAETTRTPDRREFFRSRIIPVAAKERVIRAALEGRIHPILFRFLIVLLRKERLDRIWRIFETYDTMMQERFGKVEVDVFTRYPVPQDYLTGLRARLQEALGREPILHSYVDETMIGGVRLRYGDVLVDASIATQLRKMREQFIEHGSNEVRERFGRIVEDKP